MSTLEFCLTIAGLVVVIEMCRMLADRTRD